MKKRIVTVLAVVCLGMVGCQTQSSQMFGADSPPPTPTSSVTENDFNINLSASKFSDKAISVELQPVFFPTQGAMLGGYRAFLLKITNKTSKDLFLSWDKSYFLENGEADSGFMFEGVRFANREAPKKDLLIMPKTTIEKHIYPNSKVIHLPYDRTAMRLGISSGWVHAPLKNGTFGAYLNFHSDKYKKQVKLVMDIKEEQIF